MRTFVPFALALIGTVAFTADASAFGKRNRGGSGCCGGSGCSGYAYGGCFGSGYGGYAVGYSGPVGYPTTTYAGGNFGAYFGPVGGPSVAANGGRAAMIQTTDG